MKNLDFYLKGCLMLLFLSLPFASCDKTNGSENEPNPNPDNIVGKWQKYQVLDDDGIWIPGDLDEFWIFNADGSFRNEDGGETTTVGTYQITGTTLTIFSHSIDDPDDVENFSGEFTFTNGFLNYDFYDLETGEESAILFKKM